MAKKRKRKTTKRKRKGSKRKVSKRKGKKRVKVKGHYRTFKGKKVYVMKHGRTVDATTKRKGKSKKKYDAKFKSLQAGKRKTTNPHYHRGKIVKKVTTYTETRRNRSDLKDSLY